MEATIYIKQKEMAAFKLAIRNCGYEGVGYNAQERNYGEHRGKFEIKVKCSDPKIFFYLGQSFQKYNY